MRNSRCALSCANDGTLRGNSRCALSIRVSTKAARPWGHTAWEKNGKLLDTGGGMV